MCTAQRTKRAMSRIAAGPIGLLLGFLILLGPALNYGCGIGDALEPINNVANQIEAAVAAIDLNSSAWQEIVRDLQEQLPDVENDLKADIEEVL